MKQHDEAWKRQLNRRLKGIEDRQDALAGMLTTLTDKLEVLADARHEEEMAKAKGIYKNAVGVGLRDLDERFMGYAQGELPTGGVPLNRYVTKPGDEPHSADIPGGPLTGRYPPHLPDEDESYGEHPDLKGR